MKLIRIFLGSTLLVAAVAMPLMACFAHANRWVPTGEIYNFGLIVSSFLATTMLLIGGLAVFHGADQ